MSEMQLYICDFMKNKNCTHGSCAVFGTGECAATKNKECAMDREHIEKLPNEDFMKIFFVLPPDLKAEMMREDWFYDKYIVACKSTGRVINYEKESGER